MQDILLQKVIYSVVVSAVVTEGKLCIALKYLSLKRRTLSWAFSWPSQEPNGKTSSPVCSLFLDLKHSWEVKAGLSKLAEEKFLSFSTHCQHLQGHHINPRPFESQPFTTSLVGFNVHTSPVSNGKPANPSTLHDKGQPIFVFYPAIPTYLLQTLQTNASHRPPLVKTPGYGTLPPMPCLRSSQCLFL